jgi:hypothetical protein
MHSQYVVLYQPIQALSTALTFISNLSLDLFVQERKTRDEAVTESIKVGLHIVLAIVTEELQDGKHGKASMLQLIQLTLLKLCATEKKGKARREQKKK